MTVQNAPNDALSDVLRLVDAQAIASMTLTAGVDWAIRFAEPDYIKFYAVRRFILAHPERWRPAATAHGRRLLRRCSRRIYTCEFAGGAIGSRCRSLQ